ncbi:UDP-3-O-(3-hydroxymyristoyl)glucosamine N-acyltransferase [Methylophaga sp. OBS3]|uniref:UDP-3-O-(3-hydroxymyristoyl)glucosamine N-acyltransferase n=1 Tax=Methylophaga sp. OBS3 TaxID=2991934 RepID=UPI002254BE56|nr:UDP-3-O-(3-hydroxymyristoyl)glucosamine N-acyltransferase [Methylophaga sp. OBS3]MCX4190225.1 UDP-3-O-(3-hydroxymyristoyl)glucosamine N-acyltransferase [Methylophaga sp. OBS3]
MVWTLSALAERVDGQLIGLADFPISNVGTLQNAGADAISFLANSKYRKYLQTTRAGAVIVSEADSDAVVGNAIVVADPYVAYANIASLLFPQEVVAEQGIHPSAVIDASANVDPSAGIGPQTYIAAGVTIAAGVQIGPGCIIEKDVQIGENSILVARVTLNRGVKIGQRAMIHPGVVIGADGFGIALTQGRWIKVPQVGSVQIGDDVDIGANTTIDRGAIEDTFIANGVKLDNQIQIGHNVSIGEHTVIAGCVGIAGSTHIGKYCAIGGGTGIAGHIEICDQVQLTGMSMVTKSITEPGTYSSGIPVEPTREWHKNVIRYRQMDKLQNRIKQLESQILEK